MAYAIAFGIALIVTYVITPAVKRLACRVGAMDNPNARKVHHGAVPRLGGLGIYIGFLASVLYSLPLSTEVIGLLMGSAVIIAVGIWDDICQIPAKVKVARSDFGGGCAGSMRCARRLDFKSAWRLYLFKRVHFRTAHDFVGGGIHQYGEFDRRLRRLGSRRKFDRRRFRGADRVPNGAMEQRGDYGRDGGRGNRFSAVQFQPREDFHGRYGQHVLRLHARRGIDHGCDENSGYRRFGCAGHSAGLADYGYGAGDRAAQAFGHADFRAGPRAFASPSAR